MKRILLTISVLISGILTAQSLDLTNEAAVGDSQGYYLCDSNAVNFDLTVGDGVTWDYSTILGVPNQTRVVDVIDATTSTFYSDFPGAVKATSIENALTTFYSSDANERISQGFVFQEPSFGDVIAKWTNDAEKTHVYPMSLGTSVSDVFDGSLDFTFNGIPQTPACNGNVYAIVDGRGTIKLPGNDYTNVIRYKMIDTAFTNVILVGDLEVVRTQYEYYDLAASYMPLFIHVSIKIQTPGGANPLTEQNLVLCKDAPLQYLNTIDLTSKMKIYPIPTDDFLVIEGDLLDNTSYQIFDQTGRTVLNGNISNGLKIDLSSLNSGTYLLQIPDSKPVTILKK